MNIAYNASAGTGKTYQMTRLYEELVMNDGVDPRKILLMTFTENAAAELRMRVSQRLLKARRTAEQAGDDELTERAMAAMTHLPSAPIGTIHSFCTRLLREHALEAGLSPGFSVLEGDERKELLNQICREELLARLVNDPDFKTFCAGAQIIGYGRGFGTSISETVPTLIAQAGSLGIALEEAESMLPDPQVTGSLPDFTAILHRLKELPKPTARAQVVIQCLEDHLPTVETEEELVRILQKAKLSKFGQGKGHKPISDDFWNLLGAVDDSIKYKERFPAAKAFARYVQAVAMQFRQNKHAMDAVDFDDQLRMAAELLHSGKAKPEFEYILVDEVQDTSRIQCDLIQSLWCGDAHLIICGDRKQSIYTWRGADPQVMPDLEASILEKENSTLENLQTSYRSKTPILDVVNALFTSVYGDADYTEGDRLEPNPDFITAGEKPCVEFLEPDDDDALSRQERTAREMEAVANRIQLLVGGNADWAPNYRYQDGFISTAPGNSYCYADILILLRRTTHQSVLEQALRHANVPYTLGGKGRGLFSRQETRDVSLFLNVITNPSDAYSLVGFLRAPWVGLSDETIAELAWSENGFSIEHLTGYFVSENADRNVRATCGASFPACPSAELVLRYRNLSGTKLASELVRMIVDETGYDALLAGLPRGAQRLANLQKVIDWLREAERGARTTPGAVARKLAEQIASPPDVPEAALLDPAQDAVTIMTVHGAKGLTKRVVFLPDISSRPKNDTNFCQVFFAQRNRDQRARLQEAQTVGGVGDPALPEMAPTLGIKITAPDKTSVVSPGFKDANDHAKAIRDHEQKNLFYVAMTRARDLVVTSATIGQRADGWYKELTPMIGKEIPAIAYSTLSDAARTAAPRPAGLPSEEQLSVALESLPQPPSPPALQRMPATRLAKEDAELDDTGPVEAGHFQSMERAAALGSLGHAVLEQLTLNGWEGSVADWLETLREEFRLSGKDAQSMTERIERTRALMMELTADMLELHPEFPFVLHEDNHLIDGTIDLLCRTTDGFAVFDYKFTESDDATVTEQYRGQLEIYTKAAQHHYPDTMKPEAKLVVVSSGKPRIVSINF